MAKLAFARSAAAEMGKGLSLALTGRAGSHECAPCPSCSLVCPEPARIPDCVCQAGERQVDPGCPPPPHWSLWCLVFLVGVLIGIGIHWKLSQRVFVEGRPVVIQAEPEVQAIDLDREIIAAEARLQIAAVKAKARNGTGAR